MFKKIYLRFIDMKLNKQFFPVIYEIKRKKSDKPATDLLKNNKTI